MNQTGPALMGMIFDKDGTLFDFNATWASLAQSVLADLSAGDPQLQQVLADVIAFDLATGAFRPDSIVIAHTSDEVAQVLLPHLPGWTLADLIANLDAQAANAPQAEATDLREFVGALQSRGLKIGVATNDAEAPARAHLDSANVAQSFDFIAGYDSGWGGKPAPGQLLAFCQKLDLDPANCAMVGDSLHDLHAGQAAGMVTIGVLTGMASRADLTPHANVVFDSIAEIPAWLDQNSTTS
jgi:phosphoglycolate phosphatase